MSNVVDFNSMISRLRAGDSGGQVADTEIAEGPMEYGLHDVSLALGWAIMTRRRVLAQRLFQAIAASGFDNWVLLTPELGEAVEEADRSIAMFGKKS